MYSKRCLYGQGLSVNTKGERYKKNLSDISRLEWLAAHRNQTM